MTIEGCWDLRFLFRIVDVFIFSAENEVKLLLIEPRGVLKYRARARCKDGRERRLDLTDA
jgi:hypothetical protein